MAESMAQDALGSEGREQATGGAEELTFIVPIGRRVREVAGALGSNANLAALLEVSPSQPTRWIQGSERPNSLNARAIVDLDHVVARAALLWQPTVVTSWLYGHNAFLGGARPIDVVKLRGAAPVIEALDQELAGGYA